MANTQQPTKKQFVIGKTVNVWKDTGVRNLKGGPCTSERTGGDYEDITPSEDLMVLKKFGSTRALVRRADGSEVTIHVNHINASSTYYANRAKDGEGQPKGGIPTAKRELEIAMKRYEAALAEEKSIEQESVELTEAASA